MTDGDDFVRPTPLPVRLATTLVAAALLAGCTGDPAPTPTPSPSLGSSPLPAAEPDREALDRMVAELRATVTALRTELEAAAAGDAEALATAAELLVADVAAVTTDPPDSGGFGGSTDTGSTSDPDPGDDADASPPAVDLEEPAPILPGPLASRQESIQYGDLLTRTLAAARGAGPHGEPVVRFLAEPLAGDLGSWQRSPADQLAAIARAGTAGDLTATEAAVLELGGEAPRALAWVVHGLTEPTDTTDAAGRALAHLAIIELSLEQLE